MKALKYTLCIALMISAIVYAGKITLGPTKQGMIFLVKDAGMGLEEYTVTNAVGIKDWVVITGGGPKSKIMIDGKSGQSPDAANIVINTAKMIKGKKTAGTIDNLLFGVFTPGAGELQKEELGNMERFEPNAGLIVKLKGTGVGTVIAADNKMVQADSIVNFATDTGFKNKGAKIQTKLGDVGGTVEEPGWLGIPTDYPSIAVLADYSDGCQVKMVKAKGAIDNLNVYASGIAKNGKPKSKMKAKVGGGEAVMYTETGWRTDKFKGVTPVTPTAPTNAVTVVE